MDEFTEEVHIYRSDDLQRLAELNKRLTVAQAKVRAAQAAGVDRGVEGDDPVAIQAEIRKAVEAAAEHATTVVVQHLGKSRWRSLLAAHRPRYVRRMVDGQMQDVLDDDDAEFNVNTATFPDALLGYVDPSNPEVRTIKEPAFATSQDRETFIEGLRGGDFDKLWVTAHALNSQQTIDPKALLDSLGTSLP